MQRVQAIQRVMQEEPMYTVKPHRSGHKVREAASTVVRDPNLEATALILQELENEQEFLCAPLPLINSLIATCCCSPRYPAQCQ